MNRRGEDWDWNWSTEGELRFNATTTSKDGTSETITRVAALSVFAPNTFQHLRNSIFGINEADYRRSIFGSGPFVSFQSNSKGAARVGGVFFFTRDGAYMVKTIKVSLCDPGQFERTEEYSSPAFDDRKKKPKHF